MKLKTLSLICLLVPAAARADHKTIPAQVTEAKTVSIVCDGKPCSKSIQSAAVEALRKWKRYTLAQSDKDADLILSFEISAAQYSSDPYRPTSMYGQAGDIAQAQHITKHWTLSILDNHQAAHPKLLDIIHTYSEEDGYATYDLIRMLMKDVGKIH